MLRWFENRQVYHPTREWNVSPAEAGSSVEDVYFTTADGVRLNAWFFPAGKNSPRASFAALVCHGNGGNVSHRAGFCQMLVRLGLNAFVFDYRGYGRSEGRPTEEGTYQDAQAAYRWLRARGFVLQNIIALGKSLGGAVATELALRETVGGLVLQSAFTSIADVGEERFPWLPVRRLHRIKYETLKKLPRLQVPVLILHSRDDETISFSHGERNFAAITGPKLFVEVNGPHNYRDVANVNRHAEGLEKFLRQLKQRDKNNPLAPEK
jgi:hypothetical protein